MSHYHLKENTEPMAEMGGITLGFKGGGIKVDTMYVNMVPLKGKAWRHTVKQQRQINGWKHSYKPLYCGGRFALAKAQCSFSCPKRKQAS